ncbi:MAG TPA: fumarylacetoacetate hydrolase family protein [Fimbriimonadaceae bacterium]|nr:fumarylacetoacetate hydrolase family protein [Fimbriimonadaceae bacterium]
MKLCRFELLAEPGRSRSGFAFQGKVYETDGQQPIGIHEPGDVRLLAPVLAGSIRIFSGDSFTYLNPASAVGTGEPVLGRLDRELSCRPCLVAVIASHGRNVEVEVADDIVLGLTLGVHYFFGEGTTASDADAGFAFGPAISTPEDLAESGHETKFGKVYGLSLSFGKGGTDPEVISSEVSFALRIAQASETAPLRPGDLFAVPVGEALRGVQQKDEIHFTSETLGALRNWIQ